MFNVNAGVPTNLWICHQQTTQINPVFEIPTCIIILHLQDIKTSRAWSNNYDEVQMTHALSKVFNIPQIINYNWHWQWLSSFTFNIETK